MSEMKKLADMAWGLYHTREKRDRGMITAEECDRVFFTKGELGDKYETLRKKLAEERA